MTASVLDEHGKKTWIWQKWHGIPIPRRSVELHSPVLAFLDMLYNNWSQTDTNIKDTSGAANTYAKNTYMQCDAAAGSVLYGIVVGTGSTAPAIDDFVVDTLIAHGNGAGQVNYGIMAKVGPATVGGTRTFHLTRGLTGNAVGAVNVGNTALYTKAGSGAIYWCVDHSLLSFTIPQATLRTVDYAISITV